jgi:glycosyltransferase involved in cell wall biosynthesis/SAM-dependent methyltransferase
VTAPAPVRVLVAARWYPAHDDAGRGIFVADLVRALGAAGVESVVASWEPALAADPVLAGGAGMAAVRDRLAAAARRAEPVTPRSWGAPGTPVVRLPAIVPTIEGVERDPLELAELQAATLVPFGTALAERWPYALVHAHTGLPDGLAAARLADRLGLPLLVTEHDSTIEARLADERLRGAYRTLLEGRKRVVAVSASLRDGIARRLDVDPVSIGVVPNVVDVDAFRSAPMEGRDPTELLWVGARKASKGTDTLLRALALILLDRPGLHLRLVGSAPGLDEEARLRALAETLGIADAVTFEPPSDRPGVAAAMARAAVFVHPSPRETFGVVAAEALAAGLPVAATPSGGVEEIVGDDGRCGTIASDTSPEALAAAVRATLDRRPEFDPGYLRDRVVARYSLASVATATLELYGELGVAVESRSDAVPSTSSRATVTEPAVTPGTTRATDPAVDPAEPPPVPLIVSFRRRSASVRLATVPSELARTLEIVTASAGSRGGDPLPPGRWLEVDVDRAYREAVRRLGGPVRPATGLRRLLRPLRHPIRTIGLRRLASRRAEVLAAERLTAIEAVLARRVDRGLPRGPVLALDADDVAVLGPLLDAGVELFPGTLRSLVDRWDAAGRPPATAASLDVGEDPDAAEPADPTYDPTRYWGELHRRSDLSAVGQAALPPAINDWLYRILEGNLRRFLRRCRLVAEPGRQVVFDVGIGIGYWVRFWRSLGYARVDGCDLVPEVVARADAEARARGDVARFVVADVSDPAQLPDERYDLVSCMNVLLHVVDDATFERALHGIARLVAPGGALLLAEPILLDPSYELPFDPTKHSRARALQRYRGPLEVAGLQLVDLRAGTVLANNPIEAGSPEAFARYTWWWRLVARRTKANPRSARWIGPLLFVVDRLAMSTRAAPTTKFALFRRPPLEG